MPWQRGLQLATLLKICIIFEPAFRLLRRAKGGWVQAVNATRYLFADEDGVLYEQMNLCAILARDSKRYLDAL